MTTPRNPDHIKYTRDAFEFRVFADRVEIEGPNHQQTLTRPLVQLYYEFFVMLHNDALEVKSDPPLSTTE